MYRTKMYFSGSMKQESIDRKILESGAYRLYTFAYPKEAIEFLDYADSIGMSAKLLMDSGAFTAWNIGTPVELQNLLAYDKYLLDNYGDRHEFKFISLDVIPGERGRAPTEADILSGMDISYNNYLQMQQELSVPVLPVYHSGEPVSFRDKFLNHTNYICLSMDQGMAEKNRVAWAKEAYTPGVEFHGLAATGNRMLTCVDWYSVDSAGWLMVAAMGAILFPYGDELKPLPISKESPSRHKKDAHLTTLQGVVREETERKIYERGYNPQDLQENYISRMMWNIDMWLGNPWVKAPEEMPSLFDL